LLHRGLGEIRRRQPPSAKVKLVKPETLQKLHTPAPGDPKYAMGWIIVDGQPWAGGPVLAHSGSNTMWMAVVQLAPAKDFAVLVACNQANDKPCNDAVRALTDSYFKE
jgi:hypothetical protein